MLWRPTKGCMGVQPRKKCSSKEFLSWKGKKKKSKSKVAPNAVCYSTSIVTVGCSCHPYRLPRTQFYSKNNTHGSPGKGDEQLSFVSQFPGYCSSSSPRCLPSPSTKWRCANIKGGALRPLTRIWGPLHLWIPKHQFSFKWVILGNQDSRLW